MIANTLLVLATAALAAATPINKPGGARCKGANPVLPVNGDFPELPAPPAGARLKRIALGYGIQNYTCAGADAAPVATGALAGLFDITPLYPNPEDPRSLDQATFDRLTAMVVESASTNIPLQLVSTLPDRVPNAAPGADASKPFLPAKDLPVPGLAGVKLKHTGEHFFTDAGVPMFKLDDGLSIQCAKLDGFNAPKSAAAGPHGEAAVAWLRLGVKEGTEGKGTNGLKFVYRVETGGGSSHGCKDGGASDSSFYTAAYWFYG
ncbi:hypothetical protein NLU13_5660 [Sarocladium strictum]|uniref:Malate dehydrogenase n=1 Tax=Sarocladium strictum TaxID=5046 RepID=A0AA39L7V1_SARSR|nr:hypothetical protein NLU13_5660 [Sarocladium strictum]